MSHNARSAALRKWDSRLEKFKDEFYESLSGGEMFQMKTKHFYYPVLDPPPQKNEPYNASSRPDILEIPKHVFLMFASCVRISDPNPNEWRNKKEKILFPRWLLENKVIHARIRLQDLHLLDPEKIFLSSLSSSSCEI